MTKKKKKSIGIPMDQAPAPAAAPAPKILPAAPALPVGPAHCPPRVEEWFQLLDQLSYVRDLTSRAPAEALDPDQQYTMLSALDTALEACIDGRPHILGVD